MERDQEKLEFYFGKKERTIPNTWRRDRQFTTFPVLFLSPTSVKMSVAGNIRTKKATEVSFQKRKLCL